MTIQIRPAHEVLLRGSATTPIGLYHLYLATADQLTRLHYSAGSVKSVKARLKELVDLGFAQADTIPTKLFRAPFYYTLGARGVRYLSGLGFDIEESWRASKETDKSSLFVEHTLELNDVLIAAVLLNRMETPVNLEGFVHERTLKRRPYKAQWYHDGALRTHTVIPDALLDFRVKAAGGYRRFPILLEHDRGTEEQHYFRRRIRSYITLVRSGDYRDLFKSSAISIAFTTFMGEQRRDQMRAWTYKELGVTSEPIEVANLFFYASLPRLITDGELWIRDTWLYPYDHPATALLEL